MDMVGHVISSLFNRTTKVFGKKGLGPSKILLINESRGVGFKDQGGLFGRRPSRMISKVHDSL